MPKGQPAEAIVVPIPEPYVRPQGYGSRRIAELREGHAVFLAGYRKPGWYRDQLAKEGLIVSQREAEMPGADGTMQKGITVWVSGKVKTPADERQTAIEAAFAGKKGKKS